MRLRSLEYRYVWGPRCRTYGVPTGVAGDWNLRVDPVSLGTSSNMANSSAELPLPILGAGSQWPRHRRGLSVLRNWNASRASSSSESCSYLRNSCRRHASEFAGSCELQAQTTAVERDLIGTVTRVAGKRFGLSPILSLATVWQTWPFIVIVSMRDSSFARWRGVLSNE
jgi:hypothetical protein